MRDDLKLPGYGLLSDAPATIPAWFKDLAAAIQDWREMLKQQRAFDDLVSRRELDQVLAELGLSSGQLPMVTRTHPQARILCSRMMRWIRIDPFKAPAAHAMPEIERRCIQCASLRQCEQWLSAAPRNHSPPDFCPNAEAFNRLRHRQESWTSLPH